MELMYPQLPVTPPSKGRSPIDFGNASCNPVINGSRVVIWNKERESEKNCDCIWITDRSQTNAI